MCIMGNCVSMKEAYSFRRLIRSPDTVEELHHILGPEHLKAPSSSPGMQSSGFCRGICKKTELLQSEKANVSTTTKANHQKKMQEISSLVKYFIRCANKRWPRLECGELLNHVMEVLRSSFSC
ncbi:serine-protein kinase ATM-like isoform 1-T4 [Salvelinus alpinus]